MPSKVLTLIILAVFLFSACSQHNEKSEFRIQLSEVNFIYELSGRNQDTLFVNAFNRAKANYNPATDDFIQVLHNELLTHDAETRISSYFTSFELKDKISPGMDDKQVISAINEEVEKAKSATLEIIKTRLKSLFKQSNVALEILNKLIVEITPLPDKNNYLLTINRALEPALAKQLLETRGEFGFWETYKSKEIFEYFKNANQIIKKLNLSPAPKKNPEVNDENSLMNIAQNDSANQIWAKDNPLFAVLQPYVDNQQQLQDNCVAGISKLSDTSLVNQFLSHPEVAQIFPRNLTFLWESFPLKYNADFLNLVAIKISSRDGKAWLDGNYIVSSKATESNGQQVIEIKMNAEGAKIWSRMTRENVGRQIAMVFNHTVYSYPTVMMEIKEGNSQITGNFTESEAQLLASILNSGALPGIQVNIELVKN